MKKLVFVLLMGSTFLSCKKKTTESDCGTKPCTRELRAVTIGFVDNKAAYTEVTDVSVINLRTGEKVFGNQDILLKPVIGAYVVADDGNIESLSENGDDLKITATSVATKQTKSAIIKVQGGRCACHINKVSGPEKIAFD